MDNITSTKCEAMVVKMLQSFCLIYPMFMIWKSSADQQSMQMFVMHFIRGNLVVSFFHTALLMCKNIEETAQNNKRPENKICHTHRMLLVYLLHFIVFFWGQICHMFKNFLIIRYCKLTDFCAHDFCQFVKSMTLEIIGLCHWNFSFRNFIVGIIMMCWRSWQSFTSHSNLNLLFWTEFYWWAATSLTLIRIW